MAGRRRGSLTRSGIRAVATLVSVVLVAVSLVAFEPAPLPARADPAFFYMGDVPVVETSRSVTSAWGQPWIYLNLELAPGWSDPGPRMQALNTRGGRVSFSVHCPNGDSDVYTTEMVLSFLGSGWSMPTTKLSFAIGCDFSQYHATDVSVSWVFEWMNGTTWYWDEAGRQVSAADVAADTASPTEGAGGANPAAKDCVCEHADPVNSATGEFYLPQSDLSLSGVGPAIGVGRTYSSVQAAVDGPFGFGWSGNLGFRAEFPNPGEVQVVQENGSTVLFTQNGNGTYRAPPRVMAALSFDDVADEWTFTRKAKEVFVFDDEGALLSVEDLNGSAVTIGRDGSGNVDSLEASGGRSVDFTWSGDHIVAAEDSAGRTVEYDYDLDGNLASVTGVDGSVWEFGYDEDHYVTTLQRPGGGVTTNTYDLSHRVVSQEDPLERETTFAYDDDMTTITAPGGAVTTEVYMDGRLESQTRATGTAEEATTSYTYDVANNMTSVTDPLGKVTTYAYDFRSNLVSVTDPLDRTAVMAYNALGDVTSVTDALDRQTTVAYDGDGNALSVTSPGSHVQSWTYNADGTADTSTDQLGKVTAFDYNSRGLPTSVADPEDREQTITYDDAGFVTSVTDGAGKTTTLTVDEAGRALTATDALSSVTTLTYDDDGNLVSIEDPLENVTTSVYDLAGQLTSTTDATAATTSYTYTPDGLVETVTDALSHTTEYAYDDLGQLASVTDPLERTTAFTYNLAGRRLTTTRPSGAETTSVYDDAGQLTSTVDELGKTTNYAYDDAGQLTSVTDPLSRVTARAYSADGLVTTMTLPDASTVVNAYNAAGMLTSFTNPDGKATTYSYDDSGLVVSKTEPGSLVTSYAYDDAGRLHVLTRSESSTATYAYDFAGRLTGIDYSGGSASDVTYSYDDAGRRTGMSDVTGTSEYGFDDAGRLTSETNGADDIIGYAYDDAGQLTGLTYPGSRDVAYGYDDAGQMTSLTDWDENETTFAYTLDGQLATQSTPDGVAQTRAYDLAGQALSIDTVKGVTSLSALDYGYDDAGQLVSDGTVDAATSAHDYAYDAIGQLTTVDDGVTSADYDATPAGLLTANPAGDVLAYNSKQQPTSRTPASGPATSYVYDGLGSRTSSTVAAAGLDPAATTEYAYTSAGALASVTLPSAVEVAYTTDGNGLRASRTVGLATDEFLWSSAGGLPLLLDDGDHTFLYGPSIAPVAQVDGNGDIEYLHTDLIGSVRLITDDTGAVTGSNVFDAFGNRTHTGTADSAFGFTGNWTDPGTGLLYLRARDYDPATGQFLTVDPAVDATRQPYAYTGNSPLLLTDPTGLDAWDELGAFGLGALDSLTFGVSSAVLGALVPGYDCFVSQHAVAFTAGSVTATVVQAAVMVVATLGAGAGLAVGLVVLRTVAKSAVKAVAKAIEKAVVKSAERAAVRTAERTGVQSAERAGTNVVYRGLAKDEDIASGLVARSPNAEVSPISHVAGKFETPWISTSKSLSVATEKYGQNGVAAIDLSKISTEVVDLSQGIINGGRMSSWAIADQEVLVRGLIPAEAIVGIF